MDPFDITRAYQERVGSKPLLDTALMSAGAGAGAWLLSGPGLKLLGHALALGGGGPVQTALKGWLDDEGGMGRARLRLAVLAAMAGAAYGTYKHGDWKGGLQGLRGSMTDPEYWTKNPQRQAAYAKVDRSPEADFDRTISLDKTAADLPGWYVNTVPVRQATSMVQMDPILLQSNKDRVAGIVRQSGEAGKTSGLNITATAIRAGAGFASAYVLGNMVGRMLSMPPPLRNRLAMAGGIGTAVITSGLLKEI